MIREFGINHIYHHQLQVWKLWIYTSLIVRCFDGTVLSIVGSIQLTVAFTHFLSHDMSWVGLHTIWRWHQCNRKKGMRWWEVPAFTLCVALSRNLLQAVLQTPHVQNENPGERKCTLVACYTCWELTWELIKLLQHELLKVCVRLSGGNRLHGPATGVFMYSACFLLLSGSHFCLPEPSEHAFYRFMLRGLINLNVLEKKRLHTCWAASGETSCSDTFTLRTLLIYDVLYCDPYWLLFWNWL